MQRDSFTGWGETCHTSNPSLLIVSPDFKEKKKLQRQHLMMSFGPGPWETQLLGGAANPARKWGEGGGRRTKTLPWRCRREWEGDRDTAFIIIGWMPWWHASVKYPPFLTPLLPHSLILSPYSSADKSWVPFLSNWCTWNQTWYKVKSCRNRLLQDLLFSY